MSLQPAHADHTGYRPRPRYDESYKMTLYSAKCADIGGQVTYEKLCTSGEEWWQKV